jgi:hypothetical protein
MLLTNKNKISLGNNFLIFVLFVLAVVLLIELSSKANPKVNNIPDDLICRECSLVTRLPLMHDRFSTPLTRDKLRDDIPTCITTFDDADNPIYTDCCLLREDAREPCPLKCFAAVNSGDSMKSAIVRMRSNSDCWTSETAPDEGYLKV